MNYAAHYKKTSLVLLTHTWRCLVDTGVAQRTMSTVAVAGTPKERALSFPSSKALAYPRYCASPSPHLPALASEQLRSKPRGCAHCLIVVK